MQFTFEATYENGMLKPAQPLPLKERERVQVTLQRSHDIDAALAAVERGYGLVQWKGDPAELDRLALDPELGIRAVP